MAKNNFIEADDLIKKLNETFTRHEAIVLNSAIALKALNTEYKNLPSEYIKNQQNLVKAQSEIKKSTESLAKVEERARKQREAQVKKESDLRVRLNAQREKEEALQARSVGIYNRVRLKIAEITKAYNDLALKQQLGIKLSAREEAQLTVLTNRLTKYRGALNEINKKYGNYTLEVGNYAQGTKNLNFAMAQISRELPNFGQSFQVGVLSLTNNIGFLIDGINQVKAQNVELAAQGKATQSIFKIILGGIFSFQTLLFVGIGLLSAYSGEIAEWTSNLFKGEKAIKSILDVGKEFAEENAKSIGRLQALVSATQDVTLSDEQRLKALKLLNEEYPELNANMALEDENLKSLNKSVDIYIESLLRKVRVEQLNEKIGNQIIKIAEKEEEAMRLKSRLTAQQIKDAENWRGSILTLYMSEQGNQKVLGSYEKYIIAVTEAREARELLKKTIEGSDLSEELVGGSGGEEEDILKGTVKWYQELISANNELIETKKTISDLDSVRMLQSENEEYQKQIDLILNKTNKKEEESKALKGSIEFMRLHISELEKERDTLATNSREYGVRNQEIIKATAAMEMFILASGRISNLDASSTGKDFLKSIEKIEKDALKQMGNTADTEFGRFANAVKRGEDAVRELQMQTDNFINSFTRDTPLQSINQLFDGTFKGLMAGAETFEEKFAVTFNTIAEIAQETFAFVNQASEARFQADMFRLEQQRDISIAFAGDSATAREEIERQYENRRRALQQKQAEDNKKMAIFNAVINTAQGVVSALASVPPNIPLSIAIGVIGAAQTAIIASTKLPAFKDGVRNFGGGMAIVGDGGVSEVVETNKGAFSTPSRDTLINLPKGANVYKNKQEFFNEKLNDLLTANMIQPIPFNLNNPSHDTGLSYEDMDKVMGKYFKDLQVNQAVWDKNGFNTYIKKGNAKTNRLNNRVTGKGISV